MGLVSEQSLFNLLARRIELEVVPAAVDFGVGIIPWSPLQGGLLGGVVRKEREGSRRNQRWANADEGLRGQLGAYEDLCSTLGEEPATIALAWLLGRQGVVSPIIGPRTVDQFDGALRALDVTLEPEVLGQLDVLFPGHRPAPEDYAW